jgi:hypothetical protein
MYIKKIYFKKIKLDIIKRYFVIDKKIARNLGQYSECLSNPAPYHGTMEPLS